MPKPEGDTGCTATEWYRDADGDGFGDVARGSTQACSTPEGFVAASGDCDDTDAAAFPGATESCDDADQDCDGLVDEDAADARAWFADTDGDGYGAGDPTSACDAPAGFVLSNADCDDTDAGVSPDAEETCGGGDEDCDGDTTDGLDGDPWFADVDKDGFGDPSVYTFACDAPNGYVGDDTDCDDTDGDISPDGVESCNAIDDDCDGAVDEGAADGAQD